MTLFMCYIDLPDIGKMFFFLRKRQRDSEVFSEYNVVSTFIMLEFTTGGLRTFLG